MLIVDKIHLFLPNKTGTSEHNCFEFVNCDKMLAHYCDVKMYQISNCSLTLCVGQGGNPMII